MTKKVTVTLDQLEVMTTDKNIEFCTVPKLGDIGVMEFSGAEREEHEKFMLDESKQTNFGRATLVKKTACDDDGVLIFKDWSVEKVAALPFSILNPLFNKALEINGFKAKAAEEAEKN